MNAQSDPQIVLRKVRPADRDALIRVERGATPGLSYVPNVFDQFLADERGDFSAAEINGEVVGCARFTVMPDGSAWLETLRVLPQYQGMGIGKRFYDRFLETARQKGITTLRMYTGVRNAASKGLAERFGFRLAATYRGAFRASGPADALPAANGFVPVSAVERAEALLLPLAAQWGGFLVMNRTFYAYSPALCVHLVRQGMVFEQPGSGSLVVLGARFMPEQALHIGLFAGNVDACLAFAGQQAAKRGAARLSCLFPPAAVVVQETLLEANFQLETSDFIVMERKFTAEESMESREWREEN